jgi:hypothetical protein
MSYDVSMKIALHPGHEEETLDFKEKEVYELA